MALQISSADIGADTSGVQTALNNLQVHVIQDTISKMNNSMQNLRNSVDEAWVGQSAENFKDNMETDKTHVINALNETFEGLKSEINQIVARMGEADEALVERR